MIKYSTFSQVRGHDQMSNKRNTQIYFYGLISVELRNFEVINSQGLLDLLNGSTDICTI